MLIIAMKLLSNTHPNNVEENYESCSNDVQENYNHNEDENE